MATNSEQPLDLSTRREDSKSLECGHCGNVLASSSSYDLQVNSSFKQIVCKTCVNSLYSNDLKTLGKPKHDLATQRINNFRDKTSASPENEKEVESNCLNEANECNVLCNSGSGKEGIQKVTPSSESLYKCSVCTKSFTNSELFESHRKKHNKEKTFKCPECKKGFTRKSGLTNHLKTHSRKKPLKCPNCAKCFSRIAHLIDHLRSHSGEKPFKCSECDKCFSQKSNLTVHQRIHSGEKPFQCFECGKCFLQSGHLNTHKKVHKEKPFTCKECKKFFRDSSTLKKHKLRHASKEVQT